MSTIRALLRNAALASAVTLLLAAPGHADPAPTSDDWGTVTAGAGCVQSDAWVARSKGGQGPTDSKLFESHYPAMPQAPGQQSGGLGSMDLAVGGRSLGRAAGVHSRALGPGVADAGGTAFDVERSPVGVNVGGLTAGAATRRGEPLALTSGGYRGFVAVRGRKVADIPASWPVNYSVRIPQDPHQPVIAIVVTNEQVTTDDSGRPTLDVDGHYRFDPKARSGYVNAIHITYFGAGGPEEITVAHAAVLRTCEA